MEGAVPILQYGTPYPTRGNLHGPMLGSDESSARSPLRYYRDPPLDSLEGAQ
jgi:hypothetical protein